MIPGADWFKDFRKFLGDKKQGAFGKRFGVDQASVSRWENGGGIEVPNWEAVQSLAIAKGFPLPSASSIIKRTPLVGYVGVGAVVHLIGEGQATLGDVEMPPVGGDNTVALEIRENYVDGWADDNWVLYYNDRHEPPHEGLHGKLCVVGLADNKVLAKKIAPGRQPGLYDLYSSSGAPMFDQPVVWAAKVDWLKQR